MNIVISGLGIIGGSFAKALVKYTDHHIIGINRSEKPLLDALAGGAIHEIGTPESIKTADMIILGTFPEAAVQFVRDNAELIPKSCIVTDTSGIKSRICPELVSLSREYGFRFIGGHPMAGKEKSGFDASDADLFKGASYIIVPCGAEKSDIDTVTDIMKSIGFGSIVAADPEEHDRMIAFTSQLPHVIACAYVLNPSCKNHKGFSGGSYRDVSRVARINSPLWTELFAENRDSLVSELDIFIENITELRNAIDGNDSERVLQILSEARKTKEEIDG